jgi:hypothetical protein
MINHATLTSGSGSGYGSGYGYGYGDGSSYGYDYGSGYGDGLPTFSDIDHLAESIIFAQHCETSRKVARKNEPEEMKEIKYDRKYAVN